MKALMKQKCSLSNIELRDNNNFYTVYENAKQTMNIDDPQFLTQARGVKCRSELSSLNYFKIPENIGADVFHDLNQGICIDAIGEAIECMLQTSSITITDIESRIISFNYGLLDMKHRPRQIKHMSGVQTLNLVYRFNFIFHDIKNANNVHIFKLMATLVEIIKIVYSSTIVEPDLQELDQFIKKFLHIWTGLMHKSIKPKSHFLLHYCDVIRRLGPLSLMETSGFERKHRFFTEVAEKHGQFSNILKSCVKRHQLWWLNEWKNAQEMHSLKQLNPEPATLNVSVLNQQDVAINLDEPMQLLQTASLVFKYMPKLCVVKKIDQNYCFYRIEKILLQNNSLFFLSKTLKTEYNSFYASFKILDESRRFSIISYEDLLIKEAFQIQSPYNNQHKFVLCKKNVL